MNTGRKESRMSTVLVDESFAAEDDRFVERVRQVASAPYLAGLADRWKKDPRPWARQQVFDYLHLPLDRPGHHPVVKRLFKQAEAVRDHALMAEFIVVFDRLVRRQRRIGYRYDYQTGESRQEEELFTPRDQILAAAKDRIARNPLTGETIIVHGRQRIPRGGRLFSYATREYLRRRAWRYFRRMGFQNPLEYPPAVAAALALYVDDDVARGENILDSWSLMHIAFRRSPMLQFTGKRVELVDGRSLGELTAAPQFEELWQKQESAATLLKLLLQAQARLVRVWAMQLLKRLHAVTLQAITAEQLLSLLDHADEEVQQFGAGCLESLEGVSHWPVATWLRLLETRSVTALATICETMKQRVDPARLSIEQCVELARARATPAARLGLSWLSGRKVGAAQERALIMRLAEVQCEAVGAEAAQYALSILGSAGSYRTDDVIPFFDSLNPQVRQGARQWVTGQSPAYDDEALWSRLLETPHDDMRLWLVAELNKRSRAAAGPAALARQDLAPVWMTVLLNVHRGGRAKLTALRQISQAIARHPEQADRLVPVLAVAIRSVRPPEARAGLSAILSAVSARPELEASLARCLPELRLKPVEAAP
jgi:hypothetical protein